MSIDYINHLAVGVPLKSVVQKQETPRTITRYNETTGEPYELPTVELSFMVGGNVIEGCLEDDIKYEDGMLSEMLEEFGLSLIGYDSDYQTDLDHVAIGIIIKHIVTENISLESITLDELKKIFDQCREVLESLNVTESPVIYTARRF